MLSLCCWHCLWLPPAHRFPSSVLPFPRPRLLCSSGSLVAEFDLVCGRSWVLYLQSSAFFIAVLAGCILWQAGSERYGERPARCWDADVLLQPATDGTRCCCTTAAVAATATVAQLLPPLQSWCPTSSVPTPLAQPHPASAGRRQLLVAGATLCGLSSMLASTAPSLWIYVAFRCASGLGVGGMGVAAFALAADLAGPSWRSFTGLLINCFFSGGFGGLCASILEGLQRGVAAVP